MIDSLKQRCEEIKKWDKQTCAAMLTPAGRGAVATIAVRGPHSVELVEKFFQSAGRKSFSRQQIGRINYGKWQHGESHEDVVLCRFKDRVEIQSHGGRSAPESVLNALKSAGCVILSWQDWLWLTEANPVQAIIAIAIAEARTKLAVDVLQSQYSGALLDELKQVESLLSNHFKSGSTSDQPNIDSKSVNQISSRLDTLIDTARWATHLLTPRKVIIAGPPNAGKSSLLNALVGYDRAIVFDQPGTTRDVVTAQASYNGWLLEFRDTAGLRDTTSDNIERAGIDRATTELSTADTTILVFDGTLAWTSNHQHLFDQYSTAIIALNKSDAKEFQNDAAKLPTELQTRALSLSARNRTNLDQLFQRILSEFVPATFDATQPVLFEPMLIESVKKMRENLGNGAAGIHESFTHLRLLINNPLDS